MKPKISIITLGVEDLDRSKAFYRDGLGFPVKPFDSDKIVFFDLEGSWLALFGRDALAEDAGVERSGSGFCGATLAQNVASRDDVDALVDRAVAAGGTLIKTPRDKEWGGYSGYFSDPDGHLWEIAYSDSFQPG